MLTKNCIVCGKEFTKPYNTGLPEWKTRRFCSKSCAAKYCKNGKKTIFTRERHYVPPTAIKKGQQLSPKTQFQKGIIPWNKGKKGIMPTPWNKGIEFIAIRGEKHPNWKGGKTGLRQQIRHSFKYKQWRTAIFKRDNWTCCECGRKRKKGDRVVLQVHHKKAFYKIFEDNNIKTLEDAKKCDELWNLENGETLCIACHRQTESYLVNQYTK